MQDYKYYYGPNRCRENLYLASFGTSEIFGPTLSQTQILREFLKCQGQPKQLIRTLILVPNLAFSEWNEKYSRSDLTFHFEYNKKFIKHHKSILN